MILVRKAEVDFSKKLRDWDGFGINYVELAQSMDYEKDPQEYGGLSIITEDDRQEILDMIFGEDGLKPGTVKMFFDPFQQKEENQNDPDPAALDMSNYDHQTTTKWMRYFIEEGLKRTKRRGDNLEIITTLYGPPAWMTAQKLLRGRDLDPEYKVELAKYMIAWIKYLKEEEKFPVKYLSLHNEGEDWHRWPLNGSSGNIGTGHDYNMYWPPELVAEFLEFMREIMDMHDLSDVALTPGETSNWYRFVDWGYAYAIDDSKKALENLGLITSHGFYGGNYGAWFGPHKSLGIDILREKKTGLHTWVTSTSWSNMDSKFVYEIKSNIYSAKVNSIIPWACIQRPEKWVGGDPNPGTAFEVFEDGTYKTMPGYYYYKQVCRVGQAGMAVARTISNETEVGVIAFSSNGTDNPDAFVVINIADKPMDIDISVKGIDCEKYEISRTSPDEQYKSLGDFESDGGLIKYTATPDSVTTFVAKK